MKLSALLPYDQAQSLLLLLPALLRHAWRFAGGAQTRTGGPQTFPDGAGRGEIRAEPQAESFANRQRTKLNRPITRAYVTHISISVFNLLRQNSIGASVYTQLRGCKIGE